MKKTVFFLILFLQFYVFVSCEKKIKDSFSETCVKNTVQVCEDGNVHSFNFCGEDLGIVTECKYNEKCEEDKCVPCEITSDCAKKGCYEGHVYCYNNCDKRTDLFQECEEGTACSNGKCKECNPVDLCVNKKCYDGNVFCVDDCGKIADLDEVCSQSETCENGACYECEVTEKCKTKKCEDSTVYCYNNCGKQDEIFEECEEYETCKNGECVCIPDCEGKNCGTDGCGGSCGECSGNDACINGKCGSVTDKKGPVYEGNVLLIVNIGTNGNQTSFTGTIPQPVLKNELKDDNNDNDNNFVSENRHIHTGIYIPKDWNIKEFIKNRNNSALKSVPQTVFAVGDTDVFWVAKAGTSGVREATATLQFVGAKSEVWAENVSKINKITAEKICNEFDNKLHPLVTSNFYEESDVNKDGKIAIFVGDLGGTRGGYFNPGDLDMSYYYSNKRDMLYIEQDANLAYSYTIMVHEFQHLCNANRNLLIEGDESYSDLSNRWIDEGLATASEHLYLGTQLDYVKIFNNKPYSDYVAEGNGFLVWDYTNSSKVGADYALTYVFFQYLRLQAEDPDGIYKELIENDNNDWKGVKEVIQSRIKSTMTFSDFMINFRTAMLLNKPEGIYGFMKEPGMDFKPAYYTGTGKNLEGGGALYVKIDGSFTEPSDKGSDIVYIGITTE